MLPLFPNIGYGWYYYQQKTDILLSLDAPYNYKAQLNRFYIIGPQGYQLLTTPIKGGRRQRLPIREIAIDYSTSWQKQHLRALDTAYNNSPWYAWYAAELHSLYLKKHPLLVDRNKELLQWLFNKIGIPCTFKIGFSSSPLHLPSYNHLPPYPQSFNDRHGFLPRVSLLDALFHLGKHLPDYLQTICQLKNGSSTAVAHYCLNPI